MLGTFGGHNSSILLVASSKARHLKKDTTALGAAKAPLPIIGV